MARRHLVELGEHELLELDPLGHCLDNEIHVAERLVIDRAGDQPELALLFGGVKLAGVDACLPQRSGLLEPVLNVLRLHVLEHHGNVGVGDHLRDLASHRARADHRCLEHEHAARV